MKGIFFNFNIILFYSCLHFSGLNAQTPVNISNPGFETTEGWDNLSRSKNGYYSAVEGEFVAYKKGNSSWISQQTSEIIKEEVTYSFTVYARSVNDATEIADTYVELELYSGETVLSSYTQNLSIPRLKGDAANTPQDDGANLWVDGNYRMAFNNVIMYQSLSDDPMLDPWHIYDDPDYEADMALGQIITPHFKGIYSTYYEEYPFYSEITMMKATGTPPDYDWGDYSRVLTHEGDEEPWTIDAHLFYDVETGKLWMSWGGHKLWVTEMDPATGKILGNPSNPEFYSHPDSLHTQVAHFYSGDHWSDGYMEGPCLYKRNGYWYLFGSYGNLGTNYTIRVGRATSPIGPFYDKDGKDLNNNGGTLLFGNEGEQCVPGHPHIWKENGQHYIGYDFRPEPKHTALDYMGIRKLYWINDWPTIYQPVKVTFTVPLGHSSIGQPVSIRFRNASQDNNARLAVDHVSLISDSEFTTGLSSKSFPIADLNINVDDAKIRLKYLRDSAQISIFDLTGKSVFSQKLTGLEGSDVELYVSDLKTGLYIVTINNNESTVSKLIFIN